MSRRSILSAVLPLALASAGCAVAPAEDASDSSDALTLGTIGVILAPAPKPFTFKATSGRCIDVGPAPWKAGHGVYLYDCNGTDAQKLYVSEVDAATHRSHLTVKDGTMCLGAASLAYPQPGTALQLSPCSNTILQEFVLDGDSIVFAAAPTSTQSSYAERLVAEAKNASPKQFTPIVLGTREVDDEELFTIASADLAAPSAQPNGFCNVTSLGQLKNAIARANGTTCTVITLTQSLSLSPQDTLGISIPAGTTIRGTRRRTNDGVAITYPFDALYAPLFLVASDDVRITGLRMIGPWPYSEAQRPNASGIIISPYVRAIVDHDEMSSWTGAAVDVSDDYGQASVCPALVAKMPVIHVARNYLHDNDNPNYGYGVAVRMATVDVHANTFDNNRHALTASWDPHSSYVANDNLVLDRAPQQVYLDGIYTDYEQDFDIHGSDGAYHEDGVAGGWFSIGYNTFLGTNRLNFKVRGTPCTGLWYFDNVSLESRGDALNLGQDTKPIGMVGNVFSARNPTYDFIPTGDFDGDGVADSFMGTGEAWYYRPGGREEWRFLRRDPRTTSYVWLKDLDGDRRTDVLYVDGLNDCVSYGGTSPCDVIGQEPAGGGSSGVGGGGGTSSGGGGTTIKLN